MGRKLSSGWLEAYAEYTSGTESPPLFHLWVALGTIAGAAQRKIYIEHDYYQVHSNMYIVLVSPPGRSRKSTALRIGKNVLKAVTAYGQDIKFSTQATSVAAIVKQMSSIKNTRGDQSLTAFASEFGSMLGASPKEMTDWMTDIYDCNPDWDKQTVGRGLEKIDKPWFNVIAATTPQWMGDNLSSTAVEGGFVRRLVVVYDDTRLLVAFPRLTQEQKILQKALVHDLAHIAGLKGIVTLSADAERHYTDWYEDSSRLEGADPRITGFLEVEHSHVLKVAMAISLSYRDSLILEESDVAAAIAMLEELKPGMRKAFASVGKNLFSTDMERIKQQLREARGGRDYRWLLTHNLYALQKEELDKILVALVDSGDVERNKQGLYTISSLNGAIYVKRNGTITPFRNTGGRASVSAGLNQDAEDVERGNGENDG